jgi:hypothetical protein
MTIAIGEPADITCKRFPARIWLKNSVPLSMCHARTPKIQLAVLGSLMHQEFTRD